MRFLVTTDGSERSFHVFPHAALLAKAAAAEVVLLQVLDPRLDAAVELDTDLQRASERVAAHWQQQLGQFIATHGLEARPRVAIQGQREDVEDTIVRVAQEEHVALIAMDTRGTSALRHAILGSVAAAVVGKSCLPVMLTGDHVLAPGPRNSYRMLITNDGSAAAMDVVAALAPVLRAAAPEVTLLRVYEPRLGDHGPRGETATEKEQLEALASQVRDAGSVAVQVEMPQGVERPAHAILRAADESSVNAIAMSTHGHSAARHLFAGSVTMAVLGQATVPVIVARCST